MHDHEGPVAIVVTDVEGSTGLTTTHGDDAARALMREHERLVRDALSEHGGHEVKALGDGFLAVFTSTRRAVAFAIALQRRLSRHSVLPIKVRVGVNVGEVTVENDDIHGQAVSAAARIAAAARGGDILVSDIVPRLTGTLSDGRYADRGEFELKGFAEPWRLFEVDWHDGRPAVPLPVALIGREPTQFVGREEELGRLHRQWTACKEGDGRLVLVSGEPGIGKTTLVSEFARQCTDDGIVLYGRCDEESVVPYQPFVEALRHLAVHVPADVLRAHLPGDVAVLRRLIPELPELGAEAPPPVDAETARYRLFQSVTEVLTRIARTAPLMFVVDDVHWADRPTLLLLQHLHRSAVKVPLLVVATYRDVEVNRKHPLADLLTALRREGGHERVALSGLGTQDIVAVLAAAAGQDVGRGGVALARALHDETEGNPFFLRELLRHLVETQVIFQREGRWTSLPIDRLGIPEGVREVIGRRLSRLSDTTNTVLTHASVLGREFVFPVVVALSALDDDAVAACLDEAQAAGLVTETAPSPLPTYAFTHALVRETLYDELSLPRKQRLHLRAAEAMQRVAGLDPSARISALAFHERMAGAAADPEVAIPHALEAAQHAADVFAFEEAAAHLEGALELMELHEIGGLQRAGVLERLGDLMFVTGLDHTRGVQWLEEALKLQQQAQASVDAGRIRAKLGRSLSTFPETMHIDRAVPYFHAALEDLQDDAPRYRGYLYIGMAGAALWQMDTQGGLEWSQRAVAIAEELRDEALAVNAADLYGWHRVAAGELDSGLSLIAETWERADRQAFGYPAFQAAWSYAALMINLADAVEALAWADRGLSSPRVASAPEQVQQLTGQKRWAEWLLQGAAGVRDRWDDMAMYSGRGALPYTNGEFSEAARVWLSGNAAAEAAGNAWATMASRAWAARALYAAGEYDRAEEEATSAMHVGVAAPIPLLEVWLRGDLAVYRLEQGDLEGARRHLARSQELSTDGQNWRGAAAWTWYAAARIAAAEGRHGEADPQFRRATEIAERHGNAWNAAETLHEWGRALLDAGELDRGRERLERALECYHRLGAGRPWIARVERDLAGR